VAIGPQETVLVPAGSRVLSAAVVIVCAVIEVALVLYGQFDTLLRATPAVLFAAVGVIVLFWLPRVRVTAELIEVTNPLRTETMDWQAIREVGTRWSLTLVTEHRTITAWAVPAPGALTGGMSRGGQSLVTQTLVADGGRDTREAATSLRRQGGGIALVARQWLAHHDTSRGVTGEVTTRWHVATAVTLGVLAVLTVAGALWP
jgi:hypothetical protein